MTIVPFTPPRASTPEPEAILKFGDIEVRLGLTYLHHLWLCNGWGDRQCTSRPFVEGDLVMQDAIGQIERAMWAQIAREAGQ